MLEAAKQHYYGRFYPMLATAIYAGLRLGELFALEWSDLDFQRREIMVKDKPRLGLRTKDADFRVVPMHERLCAILQPLKKSSGFCFFPHKAVRKTTSDFNRHFKELIQKAKLPPDVNWLTMRRTFGSQLAQHEVDLLRIQVWMGHSDPRLTIAHYTHLRRGYDQASNRFPSHSLRHQTPNLSGEPAIKLLEVADSTEQPVSQLRYGQTVIRRNRLRPRFVGPTVSNIALQLLDKLGARSHSVIHDNSCYNLPLVSPKQDIQRRGISPTLYFLLYCPLERPQLISARDRQIINKSGIHESMPSNNPEQLVINRSEGKIGEASARRCALRQTAFEAAQGCCQPCCLACHTTIFEQFCYSIFRC